MSRSRPAVLKPRIESDTEDTSPSQSRDASETETSHEESDSDLSEDVNEQQDDGVQDISFGALAEAQARLAPSRKRKLADINDSDSNVQADKPWQWRKDIEDAKRSQEQHASRTSKHAPTIQSTRNPVSRKRAIFSPPPADKFRDPRFDAAVAADARRGNTSSVQRANQNYAFLSGYQAAEVLDLKAQLKKTKDAENQARLKSQIMSLEARLRNVQSKQREEEILREHKRQERQDIKDGKKARPYYLKESELKKRVFDERKAAMGARARDKSEKRKRKREKTKDAKSMPFARRAVES